ncbi:hypothetical protein V8C37DRAFT_394565 [Trichoderma ceciliae]
MSALQKSLDAPKRYKNSCTECQRRKQKCNRTWPCIHCQSRSLSKSSKPVECIYIEKPSTGAGKNPQKNVAATTEVTLQPGISTVASRKRSRDNNHDSSDSDSDNDELDHVIENGAVVRSEDLDRPANQLSNQHVTARPLEVQTEQLQRKRLQDDEYSISASACPALQSALETLPQRREHMDALVLSFFQNVNPHYGLIHQSEFATEYTEWWKKRANNDPLPIPWTCLLLMMCACACQHLPVDIQVKLEELLHATCQDRTESYHYVARYLYSAIPAGRYHRNNVMWLLHSTYWYKAEAMFVECCHVFNTAVREAQELGFNREDASKDLPNFEREMRRRAWCVIDSWDWQIASGLYRDTIIDHSTCDAQRPSLTLEPDGQFSPLMHMNMQSELIHKLAKRFSSPAKVKTPSEVLEYKAMIDEWMLNFPPIFALENPDTSNDKNQAWIEYHRHYNYTMGFMMVLNPFRPHMKQPFTENTSDELLGLREIAVDLALRIVDVLENWLKFLTFRDGRFHFIIFSLVDAATVLSNIVLNDQVGTVPHRDDIYRAVRTTLVLQARLLFLSMSAKTGFRIIQKTARRLFRLAPLEHLAFMEQEKDHGEAQTALVAVPDLVPHHALMNVRLIDQAYPMSPESWEPRVVEILAQVFDTQASLQPSHDAATLFSDYDNNNNNTATATASSTCTECTLCECDEPTSSNYTGAAAALPGYDEPTASSHDAAASAEYNSSTSSDHAPVTPRNYIPDAAPNHFTTTSSYVEPAAYNYAGTASLEHLVSEFPNYVTTASPNQSAITPVYVESAVSTHISPAFPDYGVNTFPSYAAAITCSEYAATGSGYVEPALLTYNTSVSSGYTAITPVTPATDTVHVATPAPFFAPTTYSTPASHLTSAVYDDSGFYTTSEFYNPPTTYNTDAPYVASPTFAVSNAHISPHSYASSETYDAPALYNTSASHVASATYTPCTSYTSPQMYTPPENYGVPAAHAAIEATTAFTPYAPTDDSEYADHATLTSHETPENYYTCPAYATPITHPKSTRI